MTVVVPGMLNENKRKEFRPDSDNDGIIGNYLLPFSLPIYTKANKAH